MIENFPYTDEEIALIKAHFADNDPLLLLLRRFFLPTMSDSKVGTLNSAQATDVFLHPDLKISSYSSPELAVIGIQAHSKALQHVESCLVLLKVLAGSKKETVAETKARLSKNSTK